MSKVREITISMLLVAAATVAVALTPAPAHAGRLSTDPATNTVTFTAAPGEVNPVEIEGHCLQTGECDGWLISDFRNDIDFDESAEEPCTRISPNSVYCPPTIELLIVNLGDRGDKFLSFYGGPLPNVVNGGGGSDWIVSGDGPDTVSGQGGSDEISASAGDDTIRGGPGNDELGSFDEGDGADEFYGGTGTDLLSYKSRSAGIGVSLDDQANDGESGEGDNAHRDVENITTTLQADVIVGTAGPNTIDARGGDDTIKGWGGGDLLLGQNGDDDIAAAGGRDHVDAGDGADYVLGGGKGDLLEGKRGQDVLRGGFGIDTLDGGPDRDSCAPGPGQDTVRDCEA